MGEYEDSYQRAIRAVEHAAETGRILLPETDDRERTVLGIAEYFMTALGVNPD